MLVETDNIVSMTQANQNFSAVTKMVDLHGECVIFKNNRPRYVIFDLNGEKYFELTDDERMEVAARRVLAKCKPALMELAK